jgi:hypothetical protein
MAHGSYVSDFVNNTPTDNLIYINITLEIAARWR